MVYTVEEGSYFGSTQQEADSLAQAAIDQYGQKYANSEGVCYPLTFVFDQNITSHQFDGLGYTDSAVGLTVSFICPEEYVPYFKLGNILAPVGYLLPDTNRTVIAKADDAIFKVHVDTLGGVYLEWVSGTIPEIIEDMEILYLRFSDIYYNEEASQSFRKNNCSPGQPGTSVLYTVPPYTYHSLVSQSQADEMASDDIAANGQSYANANGSCLPACSFEPDSGLNFSEGEVVWTIDEVQFQFVFESPMNGFLGGVIGEISSSCWPQEEAFVIVHDMYNYNVVWFVTISIDGIVTVYWDPTSQPVMLYDPIAIIGGFEW